MVSYPRLRRSSTNVDSPPPTSMTQAEQPVAACSIRASEVSRCRRYQLTAPVGFLCVDLFPMGLCIHKD